MITGSRLKRMGVRPARPICCSCALERRRCSWSSRPRAGRSRSQRAFEAQAITAGAEYMIARSLDAALDVLWRRGFLARKLT